MITNDTKDIQGAGAYHPVSGPRIPLFPSRIGLVARDLQLDPKPNNDRSAARGFGSHIPALVAACSTKGCDTIVFSLWTSKAIDYNCLFPQFTTHSSVVLGVGRDSKSEVLQIWIRGNPVPARVKQIFARSSDAELRKDEFAQRLPQRVWGATAVIICGETNILKVSRVSGAVVDSRHILRALSDRNVRVILNPVHTYMRRYEMPIKRRAMSRSGRFVVSIWNRGFVNGYESRDPWQIFHNQKDVSAKVREINNPVRTKIGVRIGILDAQGCPTRFCSRLASQVAETCR